jgi:hypothetical protein
LIFIILIVIVLAVLALGLIFYYRKFKKVETILNYEMSDVRNVAHITQPVKLVEDSETSI